LYETVSGQVFEPRVHHQAVFPRSESPLRNYGDAASFDPAAPGHAVHADELLQPRVIQPFIAFDLQSVGGGRESPAEDIGRLVIRRAHPDRTDNPAFQPPPVATLHAW